MDDEYTLRILLVQMIGGKACSIWRVVVDDEDAELFQREVQELLYDRSYVRRLVKRREDDNGFHSAAIIASTG